MNKGELIHAIEAKSGFTKKDSEKALNATVETLTEALSTGEQIEIVAAKAPVFKAGKALKDSVNQ